MSARLGTAIASVVVATLLSNSGAAAQATAASAAAAGAVRIDASRCASHPAERIRELVSLELAPRPVLDEHAQQPHSIEADVECEGLLATLHVRLAEGGEALRLQLPLDDTEPNARTRLLALTLAELIVSATLRDASKPAEPAEPPAAPDAAAPDGHSQPGSPLLWLGGGAARQGQPGLLTPSVQLGALLDVGTFTLLVELEGQLGSTARDAAELHLQTLSGAAALGLRAPLGRLEGVLALGARGGHARLSADSRALTLEGRNLSGPFLGPTLLAALHLPVGAALSLRVAIGIDYVLLAVRGLDAEGDRLLALHGMRIGGSLGIALALDR